MLSGHSAAVGNGTIWSVILVVQGKCQWCWPGETLMKSGVIVLQIFLLLSINIVCINTSCYSVNIQCHSACVPGNPRVNCLQFGHMRTTDTLFWIWAIDVTPVRWGQCYWHSVLPVFYGDSSVDVATRCGLGCLGIESRLGVEITCSRPDRSWGSSSLLYNGYRGSFLGVKRPERGVNPLPPSSAEVKKE
jgi:hypothetical protein